MSGTSVFFSASAVEDLEGIKDWYAEQGVPDAADRLVREVFSRLENLRAGPNWGRIVPEFNQTFLRELILPPFRIVYRREQAHVRVVRIWRSERLLVLPKQESI